MAVDSKHPAWTALLPDWDLMEHAYAGETVVKAQTTTYLPATEGQIDDGMALGGEGLDRYNRYLARAIFHNLVEEAVLGFVGIMHHKPPVIELPSQLEYLRERATTHNESLEALLRRINEAQLVQGRIGLLLDVDTGTAGTLYIAGYRAQSVINWDDGGRSELERQKLNFVALDESEFKRTTEFEWEFENVTRILILGDVEANENAGIYTAGVFDDNSSDFSKALMEPPSLAGKTLEMIPFVFCNSRDVVPQPDTPPLVGLARLAMAAYRGEADYRQSLHAQGQDTMFVIGATDDQQNDMRLGAGVVNYLPEGGDAKMVGVDSSGLEEQRQAIENTLDEGKMLGARLLANDGKEAESGEALKVRVAAATATITEVAKTGAFALENLLKIAAEWHGASPDQVSVQPNLDFADDKLTGKGLNELMDAKIKGAPLSLETIHTIMSAKDLTSLTLEEELAAIADEPSIGFGGGAPVE